MAGEIPSALNEAMTAFKNKLAAEKPSVASRKASEMALDVINSVMTTTIALETSKGNLALAIGLGLVLITLIMVVNALAWAVRQLAERHAG